MNIEVLTLNNRELSFILWSFILTSFFFFSSNLRRPFISIIKLIFASKVIFLILITLGYVLLCIYLISLIGFWDLSLLKDTIFWFFGAALILAYKATKLQEGKLTFKEIIIDNIKFVIIIEFIGNQYVMPLTIELILLPLLTIISILSYSAGLKTQYKSIKTLLDWTLSVIGITSFAFALIAAFNDYQNFATFRTLKTFLLPPLLTFLYFPWIYLIALYMVYENLFNRFNVFYKNNRNLLKFAKASSLRTCLLNLEKSKRLSKELRLWEIENIDEFSNQLRYFNR